MLRKEYLYDLEKGHGELVEGLWVSVKSIQGFNYTLKLTYQNMVQYMINYHYLHLYGKKIIKKKLLPLEELELWDCFSYHISVLEKRFLKDKYKIL